MAEALLRHELEERGCDGIRVTSSGTWASPGGPATSESIAVLQGLGIDLSEHRASAFDPEGSADLIIAMTGVHLEEIDLVAPGASGRVRLLKEIAEIEPEAAAEGSPERRLERLLEAPRPPARRALEVGDPYGLPFSAYEKTLKEIKEGIEALADVLCGARKDA